MTPAHAVPDLPSPPLGEVLTPKEPDTVRKYAVRYQLTPDETQTHGDGPYDELNEAIFARNRLFATCLEVGRTWIDVLSGECILRRWGTVMKREWCLQ